MSGDDLDPVDFGVDAPDRPLPRQQRTHTVDYSLEAVAMRQAEARAILANPARRVPRKAAPDAPLLRPLQHVLACEVTISDEPSDDELIEGVIGRNAMAVLYGDSNAGKTFVAVEMACCVDLGEQWLGRNCADGLVLYLATEAAESVKRRMAARNRHHGTGATVAIITTPVNLFESDADVTAIVAKVAELESAHGRKVELIVADTLARISAGANENAGQDMGVVMKHASIVQAATGATFLWVHHCGKDQARGMRGWSGMRAHIDTEIEVTADEATGICTAEITKQRDLPGKGDRIGFRLHPVPLGVNRWGTPRGTCVVLAADAPEKPARSKRPSEIAGAVTEYLSTRGTGCLRGAIAKHFEGRYVRQSVYKELKKMVDAGLLVEAGGMVSLAGGRA